jgi:asparagine synthase (glutamine-hydrolysing)
MSSVGAVPIFGAFARTARGRRDLTSATLRPWVATWLRDDAPDDFWIDAEAGVCLLRPERRLVDAASPEAVPATDAVLAIRGSVRMSDALRTRPDRSPFSAAPQGDDAATHLLHALIAHEDDTLADLNGAFAIAVWDGRRRRLLLARDQLGQRSIFWRHVGDLVLFCSELRPLLGQRPGGCDLDHEATFWYLAFGMPPPGGTLARDVFTLPAAHVLVWRTGEAPQIRRYWSPLTADAPRRATPEVVDELHHALTCAVRDCVTPDRPFGLLLSGGIDSSYLAANLTAQGLRPSLALTGDFEERHGLNEAPYAKAVADWLGITHQPVILTAREALDRLRTTVLEAAAPVPAWAALTHAHLLERAARHGVDHLVSGLGADEIFGGYDHYRGYYARFVRYQRQRPTPRGVGAITALLLTEDQYTRRVLYPGVARFFDDRALRHGLRPPYRRWQYASPLRAFYREAVRLKPDAEMMELMIAHECQHRIPEILFSSFEPSSRATGVDVSYPFLSPRLVQRVAGLCIEDRYRTPAGTFSLQLRALDPRFKHAMLLIARRLLPEEVLTRPRKSFSAPFGGWLFDEAFGAAVLADLRRSRFWTRGLVDPAWLDTIVRHVVPGPNRWVFQLWALVTLAGWYDRYVEAPAEARASSASSRATS